MVLPRAAQISPARWLTWAVEGSGRYQYFDAALQLAQAREGASPADGAFLLQWTQDPQAIQDGLWHEVEKRIMIIVVVFSVLAGVVALRVVPADVMHAVAAKKLGDPFKRVNIRDAILADRVKQLKRGRSG